MPGALGIQPILDDLTPRPQLDRAYNFETEAQLPESAGGCSVGPARSFKTIDPDLKNPRIVRGERIFSLFDLLL